jgi:hypothetical protein
MGEERKNKDKGNLSRFGVSEPVIFKPMIEREQNTHIPQWERRGRIRIREICLDLVSQNRSSSSL